MRPDDFRVEVLIRHLAGIASSDSVELLQRWIEDDPEFAEHAARLRAAWDAAGDLAERHDPELALARVLARLDGDTRTASSDLRPVAGFPDRTARRRADAAPDRSLSPSRGGEGLGEGALNRSTRAPGGHMPGGGSRARSTRPRARWLRWAAAAAVLGGAGYWAQHVLLTPELVTRATAAGQRATLRLGDGSVVQLGPETELQFPSRFRGRARDVRLRGSAYFDVSRGERRRFTVHAAGTVTQVLGTRFLVRAYDDDPDVEVAVAEGRVAVRRDTAPETDAALVSEGQIARVAENADPEIVDADIDALLGWTEGRVVFSARPLPEVLRELERWYGRTIRIADPTVRERRVTLSFEDASLDEILEVLTASLELRVEQEAGGVAVYDASGRR